jgi:hypothetical protein
MENNQNSYDFIMDNQKKPSKFSFSAPQTTKGRLFLVGGVAAGLLFIVILASTIFGGKPSDLEQIAKLPAVQAEMIRLSNDASTKARGAAASTFSSTAARVIETDKLAIINYLKVQSYKIPEASLKSSKAGDNDKKLSSATLNNRYDEEYLSYMKNELIVYQTELKRLYNETKSVSAKAALDKAYENTVVLLKEFKK